MCNVWMYTSSIWQANCKHLLCVHTFTPHTTTSRTYAVSISLGTMSQLLLRQRMKTCTTNGFQIFSSDRRNLLILKNIWAIHKTLIALQLFFTRQIYELGPAVDCTRLSIAQSIFTFLRARRVTLWTTLCICDVLTEIPFVHFMLRAVMFKPAIWHLRSQRQARPAAKHVYIRASSTEALGCSIDRVSIACIKI